MIQRDFLESRHAQNLQKSVERAVEREPLLNDRGKHVNRDRDPNLRLHCILRRPIKRLDPQVLFDPPEEQFHAPTAFIQSCNGQRRKDKIIGEKGQIAAVLSVVEPDAADPGGVGVVGIKAREHNRLITGQICGPIDGPGVESAALEIRLGADDEESLVLVKNVETGEIEITAVEDIETAGFGNQVVQDADIMYFSFCDLDKRWDRIPQIEQRMELDGGLVFPEYRPGKKRQAQIDRCGIEGINGLLKFEPEIVVGIKIASLMNEDLGKVGVDPPVASLVSVGQSTSRHPAAESHVIEFHRHRSQASLDIAETLAVGQLSEGHGEKLIPAREIFDLMAAAVAGDAVAELMDGQKIDELGEDSLTDIHRPLPAVAGQQNDPKII